MYLYVDKDKGDHGYRLCTVKNTIAGLLVDHVLGSDGFFVLSGVYDSFGEKVSVSKIRMYISSIAKDKGLKFVTRVKDGCLVIKKV